MRNTIPPGVVSFSPTGLLNTDVSSFQVAFNEPILASSFTSSEVAITAPAGLLDPATFVVTQLNDHNFRVDYPVQSANGSYSITVGPAITDLAGNKLTAAYEASFTIDKTGPHVTALTPTGTVNTPVGSLDVTFSKPINVGTLNAGTVAGHRSRRSDRSLCAEPALRHHLPRFLPRPAHERVVLGHHRPRCVRSGWQPDGPGSERRQRQGHRHLCPSFTVSLPDLQATGVSVSPDSGLQSGNTVTVSWSDSNAGTQAESGPFIDAVNVYRVVQRDPSPS